VAPEFSAQRRHYRYTVLNQPLRSPLDRRYAHHMAQPLDIRALQAGSGVLVGMHDFAAFGRPTQGESTHRSRDTETSGVARGPGTVREVFEARWRQEGPWFTFDVVGTRSCGEWCAAWLARCSRSAQGSGRLSGWRKCSKAESVPWLPRLRRPVGCA